MKLSRQHPQEPTKKAEAPAVGEAVITAASVSADRPIVLEAQTPSVAGLRSYGADSAAVRDCDQSTMDLLAGDTPSVAKALANALEETSDPVVGHTEAGNRKTQESFVCLACGHAENADRNAAKNILAAGQAVRAEGDPSATACGGKPSGARRSRKVAA